MSGSVITHGVSLFSLSPSSFSLQRSRSSSCPPVPPSPLPSLPLSSNSEYTPLPTTPQSKGHSLASSETASVHKQESLTSLSPSPPSSPSSPSPSPTPSPSSSHTHTTHMHANDEEKELSIPFEKEYVFVCGGVGDCKAYVFLQKERCAIDLTSRNRESSDNDASDPGGRIGPYMDNRPDLRNCDIKWALLSLSFSLSLSPSFVSHFSSPFLLFFFLTRSHFLSLSPLTFLTA